MSEIEEIARDLVALWQSPVIQGLARADRNAAIEDTRDALIQACSSKVEPSAHNTPVAGSNPAGPTTITARSSVGSEQGNSTSKVEGSNPSAPANNATVAQSAERPLCKRKVGGSNPPGGTIYEALRRSVVEQCAKIADQRAERLRAKAKSQSLKPQAQPYFHQAIEARVIADAIRALALAPSHSETT